MSNDEQEALVAELREKYVLIPKGRLWHFLGGALAFAVLAFGLSFAGVLAGMKSSAAVKAASRIEELKEQAEAHMRALVEGNVVIPDGKLGIGVREPNSRLHVGYGAGYVQIPHISGSMPESADCDEPGEAGRLIIHDSGIAVCPQGAPGWKKIQ